VLFRYIGVFSGAGDRRRWDKKQNMKNQLFKWVCNEINTAEKELGHKLSWRFLTTPSKTLTSGAKIAFIALNPGGDEIPLDHEKESSEIGSAYIYENWNSDGLQQQVQALFREIAINQNESNYEKLMNESLMAYYIPFRSPNYKSLKQKDESRNFAFRLWSEILRKISPELIITIDRKTFDDIHKILATKVGLELKKGRNFPTGWGNYTVDVNSYKMTERSTVLARFPHLSRFKIFNRPASECYVRSIVAEMTRLIQ
jgi:hypothetical protein